MAEQVRFSIVVPAYNRAGFIKKTIDSVLAQDYPHFELIVVDDGSTDNTGEMVRSFTDPRVQYHPKKNEERAVARNHGTAMATGAYVTFLDSDDVLYPNHLSEALKVVQAERTPEVFHLGCELRDPAGKLLEEFNHRNGPVTTKLVTGNVLPIQSVFVRRDVALKFPFNTDRRLICTEDWDLWLRLSARYDFKYSNVITSCVIVHDARSVLATNFEKLKGRLDALTQSLGGDPEFLRAYGKKHRTVMSAMNLYVALHLTLHRRRLDATRYVFTALKNDFAGSLSQKVFWGIVKQQVVGALRRS